MPPAHGPRIADDGTTTFRVWAPRATTCLLVLPGRSAELEPLGRGWFAVTARAGHGDDYAFCLDAGPERPDPASRWQPQGVHGRSRLFDPATLEWPAGESAWRAPPLSRAVFYELHVGTFTPEGTLDAAVEHLAGLAELGVTHVELLPLNAFNGPHGWGYDGVAWQAVHEPYGGPAALGRFSAAAHVLGLAVTVDAVFNHLGPSGNYLPEYGPYLTDRYGTPWGPCLNLDGAGSDPVRALVIDSALAWLTDFHVDALRLDATPGLIDTSPVHVLKELSARTAERAAVLGRPLQLIAETDRNDPLTVTARAAGGVGLDGQWADDLHHAIHTALTGEHDGYYADYTGLTDVAAAYRRGFLYDGRYSSHRDRTIGVPLGDVEGWRLVTCVQNHDQIGNRALGERLTALVEPALVRVAIMLLCASPTTPLLFMGEEYGETAPFQFFTSHPEPDLAEAVRAGRRREFAAFTAFASTSAEVPDPQDPATFRRSRLDRSREDTDQGRQRRALWRDLLRLRRAQPALANGRRDLVTVLTATRDLLVLTRADPDGPTVLLAANLGSLPAEVALPAGRWAALLSTEDPRYGGAGAEAPGEGTIGVAPRGASVIAARP